MANEIQCSFKSAATVYALFRGYSNNIGLIWRTDTNVWEAFNSANYANYVVSLTEQGSSAYYAGNFPTQIQAGSFSVVSKQQLTGSPAQTDTTIAAGNIEWNGVNPAPLSDTATSGLVGQGLPIRAARGNMIQNFGIYLKSSIDHVTPFTSGIISGQIARDAGAFGPLQSGAFTETGLGWFSTNFTSGDLLANAVKLLFTGTGISGGTSDPLPIFMLLQRTSGQ